MEAGNDDTDEAFRAGHRTTCSAGREFSSETKQRQQRPKPPVRAGRQGAEREGEFPGFAGRTVSLPAAVARSCLGPEPEPLRAAQRASSRMRGGVRPGGDRGTPHGKRGRPVCRGRPG